MREGIERRLLIYRLFIFFAENKILIGGSHIKSEATLLEFHANIEHSNEGFFSMSNDKGEEKAVGS